MPQPHLQQLFLQTLEGDYDDNAPWDAVHQLRELGTQEVFDLATAWCESPDASRRARGLDILAQLGRTAEHPHSGFAEPAYSVVSSTISNESDPRALGSAIAALGHFAD